MNKQKTQVQFEDKDFKKATFSHGGKKVCVMVAIKQEGVGVRDSKDTEKTTLQFTLPEWDAFIKGVKAGEFDL